MQAHHPIMIIICNFILNPLRSQRPGAHTPCSFYGTHLYPATVKQMIPKASQCKISKYI